MESNINKMLSRCGYRCDLCPAYTGKINDDRDRKEVSDGWFKYFGFRIPPEEIDCHGCMGNEEPIDKECPVRPCVIQKQLDNCGHCDEMPCDKLNTRMNFLEERPVDVSKISREDFDKYIKPYLSKDRLTEIKFKEH